MISKWYDISGDVMKCENYLCVYQKENECILKEINLDVQGQCMECIYVNLDEYVLDSAKKAALQEFNFYKETSLD